MSLFNIIYKYNDIINEDAKTIAHNLWTRTVSTNYGGSWKYAKKGGSSLLDLGLFIGFLKGTFYLTGLPIILASFYRSTIMTDVSLTDYLDRSYFDSMYKITPRIENQLMKMVNNVKGNAKPLKVQGLTTSDNKEDVLNMVKDEMAKISVRMQVKDNYRKKPNIFGDLVNKSMTYYNLKTGNSFYIILLEFDSNIISRAWVVCRDSRKILHNVQIPINEIDPNEYRI